MGFNGYFGALFGGPFTDFLSQMLQCFPQTAGEPGEVVRHRVPSHAEFAADAFFMDLFKVAKVDESVMA